MFRSGRSVAAVARYRLGTDGSTEHRKHVVSTAAPGQGDPVFEPAGRHAHQGSTPPADRRWQVLGCSRSYVLFRNLGSHYDAWYLHDGEVGPADVILAEPTRFLPRADSTEGASIVAPAHVFPAGRSASSVRSTRNGPLRGGSQR